MKTSRGDGTSLGTACDNFGVSLQEGSPLKVSLWYILALSRLQKENFLNVTYQPLLTS